MAAEVTLTAIPPLYEVSPRVMAGVLESSSLPASFETSAHAWDYVLAFARTGPEQAPARPHDIVVRVTIDVVSGLVGVGVLEGDGPRFVDEVVVGKGRHVADVLVGDVTLAGELVVRNASTAGRSRGRILAIETFALGHDPAAAREPGLSFPTPNPRWNRYYGTELNGFVEKVRARAFERLTSPEVVRWSDGLSFRVVPNDQISRALYVSGTYEPNTLCVLRRVVQKGDVFLDVGANAGVFSLVAARYVGAGGHVYSFEPSEREYRRLQETIQLNGIEAIVTPSRIAVGAKTGHEMLRVASEPYSGLNTLGGRFPYDGVDTSRLEDVEVIPLDEFGQRHGLSRIDVVKIDIEGAEAAALAGAAAVLRQHRPILIVEVFSRSLALNGASVADVEQCLRDAEYRLFMINDESAELTPLDALTAIDEQNIVALPAERS